jgi:cytochrome c-type biogenesis protein CcmH
MTARAWVWPLLGLVLAGALVLGTRVDAGPRSDEERVEDLTSSFQCPTCRGQSVRDSAAPVAAAIRSEVARRVEAGESDESIRAYVVSRYGEEVLLNPPRDGLAGLVWALPVVALVAAGAGLVFAFRRWRPEPGQEVTEADRLLVERAREDR